MATYVYDALNNRIGIDDSGTQTWTVYDGTNPYADFNGSGTLKERYLFGPGVVNGAVVDEILARTSSGGTTAWYLTDKLGSVRDIVTPSGGELDHVVYDAFGNVLSESDSANGDRFKFAGMEYDPVTGQYYDRARYYDAAIGRFASLDPKGFAAGQANLYGYVGNQPTNLVDPSGMQVNPPPPQPPLPRPPVPPPPGYVWYTYPQLYRLSMATLQWEYNEYKGKAAELQADAQIILAQLQLKQSQAISAGINAGVLSANNLGAKIYMRLQAGLGRLIARGQFRSARVQKLARRLQEWENLQRDLQVTLGQKQALQQQAAAMRYLIRLGKVNNLRESDSLYQQQQQQGQNRP